MTGDLTLLTYFTYIGKPDHLWLVHPSSRLSNRVISKRSKPLLLRKAKMKLSINAFLSTTLLISQTFSTTHAFSTFLHRATTSTSTSIYATNTNTDNPSTTPTKPKSGWRPKISSLEERRALRGLKHDSELIGTKGFHHIEFYCGDAKSTAFRFSLALGMPITCFSGQSTGNDKSCSYGLESGDVRFLFTAPYSKAIANQSNQNTNENAKEEKQTQTQTNNNVVYDAPDPLPSFSVNNAHEFFQKHGLAAKAIAVKVESASKSFAAAVGNGATPVLEPTPIEACAGLLKENPDANGCEMAEVELYGDVVLRFVSSENDNAKDSSTSLPILPNYAIHQSKRKETYGIRRIDHAVGNVPDLLKTLQQISTFTGFHEFAEFTSEDIGTVDSGLNSVVLASDSENVLLPINEPTEGKRKSQIQTYLEQNEGPGLQHLALKTDDIFHTISKMRMAEEELGGFELMKRPSDQYYAELPSRLGDQLSVRGHV